MPMMASEPLMDYPDDEPEEVGGVETPGEGTNDDGGETGEAGDGQQDTTDEAGTPEETPAGDDGELILGKYKDIDALKAAHVSSEQVIGRMGRELGLLRGDVPEAERAIIRQLAENPDLLRQIQDMAAGRVPVVDSGLAQQEAQSAAPNSRVKQAAMPDETPDDILLNFARAEYRELVDLGWPEYVEGDKSTHETIAKAMAKAEARYAEYERTRMLEQQVQQLRQRVNDTIGEAVYQRDVTSTLAKLGIVDIPTSEIVAQVRQIIPDVEGWESLPGEERGRLVTLFAKNAAYDRMVAKQQGATGKGKAIAPTEEISTGAPTSKGANTDARVEGWAQQIVREHPSIPIEVARKRAEAFLKNGGQ